MARFTSQVKHVQGSSTQSSTHAATHSSTSGEAALGTAGRSQAASRGLGSPVLQAGMRTSLMTAVGLQLPSARFVASPPVCLPADSAPCFVPLCMRVFKVARNS